jgi:hypothetical protein
MGLTIHYDVTYRAKKPIEEVVKQLHSMAMDLPFESVSDIHEVQAKDIPDTDDDLRGVPFSNRLSQSIVLPWTKLVKVHSKGSKSQQHRSVGVKAERLLGFYIDVGDGCESLDVAFFKLPKTVEAKYDPREDRRFQRYWKDSGNWSFDYRKWDAWCAKNLPPKAFYDTNDYVETRTVKVPGGGSWKAYGFCKTQYASNPVFGGLANFVKCHVAVIRYLDKINELTGMKVVIEDEGHFGPDTYSDDWREARKEGRPATYVWHPATYSLETLLHQCSDYNDMIAAGAAGIRAVLGVTEELETPITNFPNFEQLEFKGMSDPDHQNFFNQMQALAKRAKERATPQGTP